jgi:hypothetical protein
MDQTRELMQRNVDQTLERERDERTIENIELPWGQGRASTLFLIGREATIQGFVSVQ